MDFPVLPPEINSARIYTGAGSGPLLAAAAAWDGLAVELGSAATSFGSVTSELASAAWQGPASVAMMAVAAPYLGWLRTTAAHAEAAASQARAGVAAFEATLAATAHPVMVAGNRVALRSLVASNLFGQNAPAIAATEAAYEQMWAQDVAAMVDYHAAAAAVASELPSFTDALRNLAGLAGNASLPVAINLGLANIGGFNVGNANIGSSNLGSGNLGDGNIGDGNVGVSNIGFGNVGFKSIGFGNSGLTAALLGSGNIGLGNAGSNNFGLANTGLGNIGLANTGNNNFGIGLTGNNQIGFGGLNSGANNIGLLNSGVGNTGLFNSGNANWGLFNSGISNMGIGNSGQGNTGLLNPGSFNVGWTNAGIANTGGSNSGSFNTGFLNSVSFNIGILNWPHVGFGPTFPQFTMNFHETGGIGPITIAPIHLLPTTPFNIDQTFYIGPINVPAITIPAMSVGANIPVSIGPLTVSPITLLPAATINQSPMTVGPFPIPPLTVPLITIRNPVNEVLLLGPTTINLSLPQLSLATSINTPAVTLFPNGLSIPDDPISLNVGVSLSTQEFTIPGFSIPEQAVPVNIHVSGQIEAFSTPAITINRIPVNFDGTAVVGPIHADIVGIYPQQLSVNPFPIVINSTGGIGPITVAPISISAPHLTIANATVAVGPFTVPHIDIPDIGFDITASIGLGQTTFSQIDVLNPLTGTASLLISPFNLASPFVTVGQLGNPAVGTRTVDANTTLSLYIPFTGQPPQFPGLTINGPAISGNFANNNFGALLNVHAQPFTLFPNGFTIPAQTPLTLSLSGGVDGFTLFPNGLTFPQNSVSLLNASITNNFTLFPNGLTVDRIPLTFHSNITVGPVPIQAVDIRGFSAGILIGQFPEHIVSTGALGPPIHIPAAPALTEINTGITGTLAYSYGIPDIPIPAIHVDLSGTANISLVTDQPIAIPAWGITGSLDIGAINVSNLNIGQFPLQLYVKNATLNTFIGPYIDTTIAPLSFNQVLTTVGPYSLPFNISTPPVTIQAISVSESLPLSSIDVPAFTIPAMGGSQSMPIDLSLKIPVGITIPNTTLPPIPFQQDTFTTGGPYRINVIGATFAGFVAQAANSFPVVGSGTAGLVPDVANVGSLLTDVWQHAPASVLGAGWGQLNAATVESDVSGLVQVGIDQLQSGLAYVDTALHQVSIFNLGLVTGNVGFNFGLGNVGDINLGLANLGSYNVGLGNLGDGNVGLGNLGFGNIGLGNSGLAAGLMGNANIGVGNAGSNNFGFANTGVGNFGIANTGNNSIGIGLTGNNQIGFGGLNSGGANLGLFNSGSGNTGLFNSGAGNWGLFNAGGNNSGIANPGWANAGVLNAGNYNTGLANVGVLNTGGFNAGIANLGALNPGNFNSGFLNIGTDNTGIANSGVGNTGAFNSGNFSYGLLLTGDNLNIIPPNINFASGSSSSNLGPITIAPIQIPALTLGINQTVDIGPYTIAPIQVPALSLDIHQDFVVPAFTVYPGSTIPAQHIVMPFSNPGTVASSLTLPVITLGNIPLFGHFLLGVSSDPTSNAGAPTQGITLHFGTGFAMTGTSTISTPDITIPAFATSPIPVNVDVTVGTPGFTLFPAGLTFPAGPIPLTINLTGGTDPITIFPNGYTINPIPLNFDYNFAVHGVGFPILFDFNIHGNIGGPGGIILPPISVSATGLDFDVTIGNGAFTLPPVPLPAIPLGITGSIGLGPITIPSVGFPSVSNASVTVDFNQFSTFNLAIDPFVIWSPQPGGFLGPTFFGVGQNTPGSGQVPSGPVTLSATTIGPFTATFTGSLNAFQTPEITIDRIPLSFSASGGTTSVNLFPNGLTFPTNTLLNAHVSAGAGAFTIPATTLPPFNFDFSGQVGINPFTGRLSVNTTGGIGPITVPSWHIPSIPLGVHISGVEIGPISTPPIPIPPMQLSINPTVDFGPVTVQPITIPAVGLTGQLNVGNIPIGNFPVLSQITIRAPIVGFFLFPTIPASTSVLEAFTVNLPTLFTPTFTIPGFTIPTAPIHAELPVSVSTPGFTIPGFTIPEFSIADIDLTFATPPINTPIIHIDRIPINLSG